MFWLKPPYWSCWSDLLGYQITLRSRRLQFARILSYRNLQQLFNIVFFVPNVQFLNGASRFLFFITDLYPTFFDMLSLIKNNAWPLILDHYLFILKLLNHVVNLLDLFVLSWDDGLVQFSGEHLKLFLFGRFYFWRFYFGRINFYRLLNSYIRLRKYEIWFLSSFYTWSFLFYHWF